MQIDFGPFRLDIRREQLLRGGEVVHLRPKTFAVLRYLAENPHRLVTKDELLDAVWNGVIVNEEAAARHVREVRHALGDRGKPATYIEIAHRRGFRFVASTRTIRDGSPEGDSAAAVRAALGFARPTAGDHERLPFVGRREQLDAVREVLANAAPGPFLLGISGEPGIGKSHLLSEAGVAAVDSGFRVHVGRCLDVEAQVPFWPWVQVLRSILASAPAGAAHGWLGSEVADLARLLPELAAEVPAGALTLDDPEQARFRLFDSIARLVRATAAEHPLALLIDDLHWADPASIALLQTLLRDVRDCPLLVATTYREREAEEHGHLRSLFARLRREGRFRSIVVDGLDGAEVANLLAALGGATVEAETVSTVFHRTGGNPYFCSELWRHLVDEGAVSNDAGVWRSSGPTGGVPEGIRSVLALRHQRLSGPCIALLNAASVAGFEFDSGIVAMAGGLTSEASAEAIDEALAAGVLATTEQRRGTYRFTHALTAEAFYIALSDVRRARLHWAIARAIEQRWNERGDASLLPELARHAVAGAGHGDADRALQLARLAVADATARGGYEAAAMLLERAVAMLDECVGPAYTAEDRVRRCELLLELAEAYERAGDGLEARKRFEQASSLARRIPDPPLFARAALGLATRWTFADDVAIATLEESLTTVGAARDDLRARLTARLAQALYMLPDTRERRATLCDDAMRTARQHGDPALLGDVLGDCLEALFHADNLDELERLASALFAAASITGTKPLTLRAHAWRIFVSMCRGRLGDAETELRTFAKAAAELQQPRFQVQAETFRAALDIARGSFASAEVHARAAARLGERINEYATGLIAFAQLFTIRREQGRSEGFGSADHDIHLPDADPGGLASFAQATRWQVPFALTEQGRLDEARSEFAALMRNLDELPPENARNSRVAALAASCNVAAALGDRDAAAALLPLLEPYTNQWVVVGFGTIVGASLQVASGALEGVLGRWDEATDHFERAIAEHERESAWIALARGLYNYAHMLHCRDRRADRALRDTLAARAMEIAEEFDLGATRNKLLALRP